MASSEIIGAATLHCGDCRDILPSLGRFDAVVTDPPYGLGDRLRKGGRKEWALTSADGAVWDDAPVDFLPAMLAVAPKAIVWGGHLYNLPAARGWLVWDKKQSGRFSTGQAELAWTNLDQPIAVFRLSRVEAYCPPHAELKEHPTQKPLRLMQWCIEQLGEATTIFDPFMGAGSTGVAAVIAGRRFVGVEKEPRYFDIACRRIERAQHQPPLLPRAAA
jgi:DNA modification methylase